MTPSLPAFLAASDFGKFVLFASFSLLCLCGHCLWVPFPSCHRGYYFGWVPFLLLLLSTSNSSVMFWRRKPGRAGNAECSFPWFARCPCTCQTTHMTARPVSELGVVSTRSVGLLRPFSSTIPLGGVENSFENIRRGKQDLEPKWQQPNFSGSCRSPSHVPTPPTVRNV